MLCSSLLCSALLSIAAAAAAAAAAALFWHRSTTDPTTDYIQSYHSAFIQYVQFSVSPTVQRGGGEGGRRVSLSRSRECENGSTIAPSTNSPEPSASTELERDLEIKRNLLSRNSEPIPYSLNSPRTTRSLLFHQKGGGGRGGEEDGEKKRSGPLAGWRAAKQWWGE